MGAEHRAVASLLAPAPTPAAAEAFFPETRWPWPCSCAFLPFTLTDTPITQPISLFT